MPEPALDDLINQLVVDVDESRQQGLLWQRGSDVSVLAV
jgi:hypothetical protein